MRTRHTVVSSDSVVEIRVLKDLVKRMTNVAEYELMNVEIVERPSGYSLMVDLYYDDAALLEGELVFAQEALRLVNWSPMED